jgi:protein-L-isoaspartate(D-aspartate) O-methyltransferase
MMLLEAQDEYVAEKLRLIMQLRKAGIQDTNVLSAIEAIPREQFVSDHYQQQAYDDTPLPIECGQTISQPTIVAWMSTALQIDDKMRVLEIGTGSGYQTAILSKLARRVHTIERHEELSHIAQARCRELQLNNIMFEIGDGSKGWKHAAPYDRIIVTAAASEIPSELIEQLADGGIMIIPVGTSVADQILLRLEKTPQGIQSQHLMYVRFVPLVEEV